MNFGNQNMGFFGGTSTGGGGGTSTGVNGLNGTTNIGLGGTLTGTTAIYGNSSNYGLQFLDLLLFSANTNTGWSFQNVDTNRQITAYSNTGFNSLDLLNNNLINGTRNVFRVFYNSTKSIFYPDPNGIDTNFGINIDYSLKTTSLGDIDDVFNKFKLIVDDANQLISTTDLNGTNGLQIGTGFTNIGQFTGGYLYLGINQGLGTIQTFTTASTSNGLSLDFNVGSYSFGSYNSVGNFIEIDDTLNRVKTFTSNLHFEGATLEDTNAPTGLGVTYLLITLNGVQYSILCTETNP